MCRIGRGSQFFFHQLNPIIFSGLFTWLKFCRCLVMTLFRTSFTPTLGDDFSTGPRPCVLSRHSSFPNNIYLGGYEVSTACFAYLTHQLLGLAGGRVNLVLEGGYHATVLADGVEQCCRSLSTYLSIHLAHYLFIHLLIYS